MTLDSIRNSCNVFIHSEITFSFALRFSNECIDIGSVTGRLEVLSRVAKAKAGADRVIWAPILKAQSSHDIIQPLLPHSVTTRYHNHMILKGYI